MSKHVLVLGLGNSLLADDGVGVHVARRLAEDAATPPWLRAVDGGTMGFRLTHVLDDAGGVLIVDAAELGVPPGTLRLIDDQALACHAARGGRTSAHEAGLADLLRLMQLENITPRRLALLAIQPRRIGWGVTLSGPVQDAIMPACIMANQTALAWHRLG